MQKNSKKLLMIFLLALALRVAWIASMDNTVDEWQEEGVKEAAWSIIEGRGYSMPRSVSIYPGNQPLYAWREPVFSFLLVPVFFLFGENYLVAKILLAILGSLVAVLLYYLGRETFDSEKVGMVAALTAVFLPEMVYWSGYLSPESLAVFILLPPILFLTRSVKKPSFFNIFLAGSLLGLAALTRAQTILITPFLLLSFVLVCRDRLRALRNAGLMLLFFGLVFSPWVIRNYAIFHRPVVIPTVTGEVLYIANNPGALKEINKPSGFFHGEDTSLFKNMSEVEISSWYRKEAFKFILTYPRDYLKLIGNRFVRFWRFYPHLGSGVTGSLYNIYHFWLSILTSGVIITLFVIGAVLSRKDWRRSLILITLIVSFSTLTILGRAVIRYRLPIMPYVILFAAYAVCNVIPRKEEDVAE
ncbi:MAG: glycosyltransferase family 39 protein [Candidatus Omnitrophota bacterium]